MHFVNKEATWGVLLIMQSGCVQVASHNFTWHHQVSNRQYSNFQVVGKVVVKSWDVGTGEYIYSSILQYLEWDLDYLGPGR